MDIMPSSVKFLINYSTDSSYTENIIQVLFEDTLQFVEW